MNTNGQTLIKLQTHSGRPVVALSKRTPLTQDAPASFLSFESLFVPRGGELLAQGVECRNVFYILKGWAVEASITRDGDIAWTDIFMRRQFAGLSCVDDALGPRNRFALTTASLQAMTDLSVLCVPRARVFDDNDEDPHFTRDVVGLLQSQCAWNHDRMVAQSAPTAFDRVVKQLQLLNHHALQNNAVQPGERLPISQAIFARMMSISAVHMNRIVQKLRVDGVVDWSAEGVLILDS